MYKYKCACRMHRHRPPAMGIKGVHVDIIYGYHVITCPMVPFYMCYIIGYCCTGVAKLSSATC